MAEFPNLKNAPSVEAVLELRVRLSSPFTAEMGASFAQRMQSTFPKADEIRFVSTHISFGNDAPAAPPPSVSQIGVRFGSVDGKWVIQGGLKSEVQHLAAGKVHRCKAELRTSNFSPKSA